MYEYKNEVLPTTIKWVSDNANEEDMRRLNELIEQRAAEGWEYVSQSYTKSLFGARNSFQITFRKEKKT